MNALMIHALPTLLLGFLIKSTFLLLAAWAAVCLLRRASAATRHLVWSLALGSVLLLPILSLSLPRWNVAWLHVSASATIKPMAAPQAPLLPLAPTDGPAISQAAPPSAPASDESESPPAVPAVSRAVPVPTSGHQFLTFTLWLGIGLVVWLIGLLSVLCQLFVGLSRLARIEHRSIPLEHGELQMAEDVRGRMGLRRPVRFLRAIEASAIAVPVTWGVFRPIVLLPAQSSAWSKECHRAALLHELAHVQRWDWPTQVVGRLACALYWWHPLVWWAARQAREDSERACDDLVLGTGIKAADYAQRLVEVVRSMPVGAVSRTLAVAMAQPSEVTGRVQAVLEGGRDRRAPSRRRVLGMVFALALGLGPVAALRLSPSTRAAGDTASKLIVPELASDYIRVVNTSDSQVTLPNGTTVRLLGIKDSQAGPSGWWRPDGTPLTDPLPKSTLVFPSLPAGIQGRTFAVETSYRVVAQPRATWADGTRPRLGRGSGWDQAFLVRDSSTYFARPSFTWEFVPDDAITSLDRAQQDQTGTAGRRSLLVQTALALKPSDRTLIHWAVAAGPWTQTVDCPKRAGKSYIRTTSGDVVFTLDPIFALAPNPRHLPATDAAHGNTLFTVTDHFHTPSPRVTVDMWGNYDRAVLALDRWGRVITEMRGKETFVLHSPTDDSLIYETKQTASVPNSVLRHVASFRLLARPYQWAEFRDIQLQPRPSIRATTGQTPHSGGNRATGGPWDWVVLPSADTARPLTFEERAAGSLLRVLHAEDGYDPTTRTLRRVTLVQYQDGHISQTTHSDDAQWLGSVLTLHNVSTQTYGADGRVKGRDHAESVTVSPLSARGTLSAAPQLGGGAVMAETSYQQRAKRAIRAATSAGEGRMGIMNIPKTWRADPTSFRSALHLLGVTVGNGNALSTTDQMDSVTATDPRTGQHHQFTVETVFEGAWESTPRGWLAKSFRLLTWDARMDGRPLARHDAAWRSSGGMRPYPNPIRGWSPRPQSYPWWRGYMKG